eukprot:6635567-Prymnesium_polylepis.2
MRLRLHLHLLRPILRGVEFPLLLRCAEKRVLSHHDAAVHKHLAVGHGQRTVNLDKRPDCGGGVVRAHVVDSVARRVGGVVPQRVIPRHQRECMLLERLVDGVRCLVRLDGDACVSVNLQEEVEARPADGRGAGVAASVQAAQVRLELDRAGGAPFLSHNLGPLRRSGCNVGKA